MKEISIKFSDYFKMIRPTYVYLQITPHKSIRNYNSSNIAKAIAHTYRAINKRIFKEQKKLVIEANYKISYVIDIKDNNAKFYFIIPDCFQNIIVEKCKEIWNKATLEIVEKIEEMQEDTDLYSLSYKKEDALSLAVDKKSNEPLNSILSVMDIMKDQDRVRIIYNFLPISQFGWLDRYNTTIDKIKEHKSIEKKQMSFDYIMRSAIVSVFNLFDSIVQIINDFTGGAPEGSKQSLYSAILGILEQQQSLSSNTNKKKEATILNTQIAVLSESKDLTRRENNALSVCQSFRVLDEDNELIYNKEKHKIKIEDYDFKVDTNTVSTDECSNFIQIPGRLLLLQHGIKHINVEENKVPEELLKGYMCLGENKYKGQSKKTYLEDDYNVGSYPLEINGSQGAGKSTFVSNIYRFARTRGEGGVLIDYIKNNELTEEILKYIPKENVILLDYSKEDCMQGFAFNEVKNIKMETPLQIVKNANLQVMQFLELVNAINDEGQPLQARMRKYLVAAGTVAFCVGETSLKSIIDCLEDHVTRFDYIKNIDVRLRPYLEDKIKILRELDEWSKPTKDNLEISVIGTKEARIEGILDRVSLLKEDIYLEYMFNKGDKDNIDLAKELEKGKLIIVKMLQDEWSSQAKDIITTFFISKIWMATEIRGKWNKQPKRTYITVDEIFQCPTAMQMLSKKNILPQTRKFGCKFVFTTQGLQQLKGLFTSIVDAGGTFMLLKGTKEEDFNLLKSKFENYEYDDLLDMAKSYKYPSLNLVYYSKGYSSFITKLPKPI